MPLATTNGNGRSIAKGKAPQGRIAASALAADRKQEPQRLDELAQAMDEDYQVMLARRTLEARVQTIPVTFSTDAVDARSTALSEHIEELWEAMLPAAMRCVPEGRVAFEKVFDFDFPATLTIVRKLDDLPFSKTEMILDDDGAFAGVKLKPKRGKSLTVNPDKAWWLALDDTPLEPHGRSRYLGAPHKTWKTRKEAMRLRDKFLRRFALGQGIYRGPAVKEDEDGNTFDNWDAAATAYATIEGGGLYTMENARDEQGEYEEQFEQLPEVEDGAPIENAIDSMDAEQIRAFGFSEKTVTEGSSVGSFAMVKSQMNLLDAVALGILIQIADSFQMYVIDKLVDMNGTAPIKLNYPRLRESVDDWILDVIKGWMESDTLSPLILSGAIDVGQMLSAVAIPVSEDMDARIKAMIDQHRLTAAQPAGGPVSSPFRQASRSLRLLPQPDAPPQEQIVLDALSDLDSLYQQIDSELLRLHRGGKDEGLLEQLTRQVRSLEVDATIAARVVGMLSPWRDKLNEVFAGRGQRDLSIAGIDNPFTDAPLGEVWRFPWIERALQWLEEMGIATTGEVQQMAAAERRRVFEAPGLNRNLLTELKESVTESLARGESLQEFRGRIDERFALDRAQTETLYRTNTHRAYVAGQDGALKSPAVAQQFPFVMYEATVDTRVRDEHLALDGLVVERGTPEYRVMLAALADWNCRCNMIPLDREDAAGETITTMAEMPPEVIARYGADA